MSGMGDRIVMGDGVGIQLQCAHPNRPEIDDAHLVLCPDCNHWVAGKERGGQLVKTDKETERYG